jgi:multidrug efflux pump subunit AcrA (membrane-fusion protein)
LEELKPGERLWTVHLGADPDAKPLSGTGQFDQIGRIIDPNQHTAQVMGWVDNPGERLLIGQFVTALVKLPPTPNLVAVPASAVIENGAGSKVIVRHGSGPDWRLESRVIGLVGQGHDTARIIRHPNDQQLHDGIKPLEPYEEVLTNGVLEIADTLEDLESENAESAKPDSTTPKSAQPNSSDSDSAKSDSTKSDSTKSVKPDSAKPDTAEPSK